MLGVVEEGAGGCVLWCVTTADHRHCPLQNFQLSTAQVVASQLLGAVVSAWRLYGSLPGKRVKGGVTFPNELETKAQSTL